MDGETFVDSITRGKDFKFLLSKRLTTVFTQKEGNKISALSFVSRETFVDSLTRDEGFQFLA